MIRLKATTTNILSEGIVKIYRNNIWKLHGIPKKILSDQGPQFALKFMEELTKALGIKRQLSTVYHPQTDGQTERIMQEIGIFLWHYMNYQQDSISKPICLQEIKQYGLGSSHKEGKRRLDEIILQDIEGDRNDD